MAQLVIINGPAGVGKSTLARSLAARAPNAVCIAGDEIRRFVIRRQGGPVRRGLTYAAGGLLSELYLSGGYDRVVFEFVLERPGDLHRVLEHVRTPADVHLLTLWAPLDVVTGREAARRGRERLGEQVTGSWQAIRALLDGPGHVVDADQDARQVLAAAEQAIAAGAGQVAQSQ